MLGRNPTTILREFARAASVPPDGPADAELLGQFVQNKDQDAFALLVRRHGPMVLVVCRQITAHTQDAEDAFQATFLVLAQKAAAIRSPERLGNWLYGVATRVARKARRLAVRVQTREVQIVDLADTGQIPFQPPLEMAGLLHKELEALPDHMREAVIMCELQGMTRKDAANTLGIHEGTLSSRLAAARKKLAQRLTRRGFALPAVALSGGFFDRASAIVPDLLISQTCHMVAHAEASKPFSTTIFRLTQGGTSVKKALIAATLVLALITAGAALGTWSFDEVPAAVKPTPTAAAQVEDPPKAPDQKPKVESPGFTASPRMRKTIDIPYEEVISAIWGPDGKSLAMLCTDKKGTSPILLLIPNIFDATPALLSLLDIEPGMNFVGFSPDGKLITALREYSLISGVHCLQYWGVKEQGEKEKEVRNVGGYSESAFKLIRTVNLENDKTRGYTFLKDGDSFLTVTHDVKCEDGPSAENKYTKLQVLEVSTRTGSVLRTVMKLPGEYLACEISPGGDRFAAIDAATNRIMIWELGTQKLISSYAIRVEKKPSISPRGASMQFSRNNRKLICTQSNSSVLIIDTEKGELLPRLAEGDHWDGRAEFFCEGQLLIGTGNRLVVKEIGNNPGTPAPQPTFSYSNEPFLAIWNTNTGQQLRGWNQTANIAAHPTRPIVAIIEKNNRIGNWRLGLWDFTPTEPKNK